MKTCECGCGAPVRRRFVQGHNGRGSGNGMWMGEGASYYTIHKWLNRKHPRAGICEKCGDTRPTEYAFLHHPKPHTRDRSDYAELCVPCHRRLDMSGSLTTCRRGHERTPANTYTNPNTGEQTCRLCRREHSRNWARAKLHITAERWRAAA